MCEGLTRSFLALQDAQKRQAKEQAKGMFMHKMDQQALKHKGSSSLKVDTLNHQVSLSSSSPCPVFAPSLSAHRKSVRIAAAAVRKWSLLASDIDLGAQGQA